jgi:hypothetical protein
MQEDLQRTQRPCSDRGPRTLASTSDATAVGLNARTCDFLAGAAAAPATALRLLLSCSDSLCPSSMLPCEPRRSAALQHMMGRGRRTRDSRPRPSLTHAPQSAHLPPAPTQGLRLPHHAPITTTRAEPWLRSRQALHTTHLQLLDDGQRHGLAVHLHKAVAAGGISHECVNEGMQSRKARSSVAKSLGGAASSGPRQPCRTQPGAMGTRGAPHPPCAAP